MKDENDTQTDRQTDEFDRWLWKNINCVCMCVCVFEVEAKKTWKTCIDLFNKKKHHTRLWVVSMELQSFFSLSFPTKLLFFVRTKKRVIYALASIWISDEKTLRLSFVSLLLLLLLVTFGASADMNFELRAPMASVRSVIGAIILLALDLCVLWANLVVVCHKNKATTQKKRNKKKKKKKKRTTTTTTRVNKAKQWAEREMETFGLRFHLKANKPAAAAEALLFSSLLTFCLPFNSIQFNSRVRLSLTALKSRAESSLSLSRRRSPVKRLSLAAAAVGQTKPLDESLARAVFGSIQFT